VYIHVRERESEREGRSVERETVDERERSPGPAGALGGLGDRLRPPI
jgi:hypothetical protein